VGVSTLTLVDESRPTEANGDYPGATSRTLVTEVWYPAEGGPQPGELRDAPLDRSQAPYPLIVFSHGLTGIRRQSSSYTAHLASHGYVVISPDFPLTNGAAPGGPRIGDAVNQPGDVSFLINSFLQFSAEPGNPFEGAIDETTIGLTGHSTGGLTSILATFGPLADPRVKAVLPLAPLGCMVGNQAYTASHIPLLVIGGSADQVVGFPSIRQAYDAANTPKYLLTLLGGNHMRFAEIDIEDPAPGSLPSGPNFLQDVMRIGQVTGADLGTCLASQNSGTPSAQSLAPDHRVRSDYPRGATGDRPALRRLTTANPYRGYSTRTPASFSRALTRLWMPSPPSPSASTAANSWCTRLVPGRGSERLSASSKAKRRSFCW
jgi:fermentation-respiration switch protein FrsA (DUF1100 family)